MVIGVKGEITLLWSLSARRLEKEVKEVLDEFGHDQNTKERLVKGRQVDLAEVLSKYYFRRISD